LRGQKPALQEKEVQQAMNKISKLVLENILKNIQLRAEGAYTNRSKSRYLTLREATNQSDLKDICSSVRQALDFIAQVKE
jgi:hypothetical protein